MKKMDEMDRAIHLRSEEWGYKTAMLMLCGWTLYCSWQTLMHGAAHNPVPSLILCISVCVQGFSQLAMKRKMVAGDEEYHEPNKLLQVILTCIVVSVLILSAGTYFLMKN